MTPDSGAEADKEKMGRPKDVESGDSAQNVSEPPIVSSQAQERGRRESGEET